MSPVEWLFWLTLAVFAYVYIGYPLLVFAGGFVCSRRVLKSPLEPTVSILIAARNEQEHITSTIQNKLALDYPAEKLQIIVVSDASTDNTDDIVRRYAAQGVVLLRQEPRNGKTSGLNMAVVHARGDVLVFADANSLYERCALRHLVSNFADPSIGYVTGRLAYCNPDGTMIGDGCSWYMRYENFIRRWETALGSVVGVNGGIDAVRRSLFQPMSADDLPDLVLPLRIVAAGYRVVYEPAALLTETAHSNVRDEYRMRVRVALRALWTIVDMRAILNVRRHGIYSLQLLSHKALRYLAFVFMVLMFASAGALSSVSVVYRVATILQLSFVLCGVIGFAAERMGRPSRVFSAPYYFLLVNTAALQAFVKLLKGQRHRVWTPRLG